MMILRVIIMTDNVLTFVGDFETTVFDNQQFTEVWASACVQLYSDDVLIFNSIDETFEYLKSLNSNVIIYYHNLKFDGMFWLYFLLTKTKLKQAYTLHPDGSYEWHSLKEMRSNTFKYLISDRGQWYSIIIKIGKFYIKIYDSLKLLPFSVKNIGKSFNTKHQKTEIEYTGFRYAGCEITNDEKEYIANDVLVVKEALEIMFEQGHTKMTIGSCCLAEYKKIVGRYDFAELFPNLSDISVPAEFKQNNVDLFIRKSYKGGWCYLVPEKSNIIFNNGITLDVNSLYPSVMHSISGNAYPVGKPHIWTGDIPNICYDTDIYYFIRINTKFKLKQRYLPCIQIKDNLLFKSTEWLKSSEVYNYTTQENEYVSVELTLTKTDYNLILKHYDLFDTEIVGGVWFYTQVGIFDDYINKYKEIKMNSKGAMRTLAKLFLNNLYGKMATSDNSSFKIAYINEDNKISFYHCAEHNKKTVYVAVGSAITSYARLFTITAAQANYNSFIYADTDSIHCNTSLNNIKGVEVDETEFLKWKCETFWDNAIFARQKTYIEHVTHEDEKPCTPYYNIKCAGMTKKCKQLFEMCLKNIAEWTDEETELYKSCTDSEKEFVNTKRSLKEFKKGLLIPGKLMAKNIRGGTVLVNTTYEMR